MVRSSKVKAGAIRKIAKKPAPANRETTMRQGQATTGGAVSVTASDQPSAHTATSQDTIEFISSARVSGLADGQLAQMDQLNLDTSNDQLQELGAVSALLRKGGAENLQSALRRARVQLERRPDDPAWLLAIAYTEWTMRNWKTARTFVTRLLSKRPDHVEGLHLMGLVETSQKAHARAEQFYARAHALNPQSVAILLNYASSKVELRKFDEVEKLLQGLDASTITEQDFRSVLIRLQVSVAEGRGNLVQAHKMLRLALARWPSDAEL